MATVQVSRLSGKSAFNLDLGGSGTLTLDGTGSGITTKVRVARLSGKVSNAGSGSLNLGGTGTLTLDGFNPGLTKVRVSRLSGLVFASNTTVRIARLSGSVNPGVLPPPSGLSVVRIARLHGQTVTPAGLEARLGINQSITSFNVATLDGSGSTGNPTSYTFSQVANGAPTVILTGTGNKRTFIPPPTVQGYVLQFKLVVTDGVSTSQVFQNFTVFPAPFWTLINGVWTAEQEFWL
jgi:hypothetical protein